MRANLFISFVPGMVYAGKQTEENCLNDLDPPIEHPLLVADPHVP